MYIVSRDSQVLHKIAKLVIGELTNLTHTYNIT